jgi:hypothetical protein
VSRYQRDGSLRPYSRFSRPEPLLFLSSSSSIVLTRLNAVPDPLHLRKCGSAANRARTSGYAARNSDHQTTEAAHELQYGEL